VGIGAVVAAREDVDVDVVQVADAVEQVVAHGLGDVMALADGQVLIDDHGDRRSQMVGAFSRSRLVGWAASSATRQ
jgi:hypothetical protein